jgi:hypothetical protein
MTLEKNINHPRYSSNSSETIGAAELIFMPVATDFPREKLRGYTVNQSSATALPEGPVTANLIRKENDNWNRHCNRIHSVPSILNICSHYQSVLSIFKE